MAKRRGYIDNLKDVIKLMKDYGFYISRNVEEQVLVSSGELGR